MLDGKIKTRLTSDHLPSEYIRNFYFDTATMDPTAVAFLAYYAPGRVLVGTDPPFTAKTADIPSQISALPESRRADVAGDTARQFFGITSREVPKHAR